MRERPNRTVSKTVVLKGTVGSNPTLSAIRQMLVPEPCSIHGTQRARIPFLPIDERAPHLGAFPFLLKIHAVLLPPVGNRCGTYRRSYRPLPLVVYSPPPGQGSLWSTQEDHMFEQTDAALVMTLLALGGIALMADEKLGTTCLQMVKWIRTRGRY